jgi:hypothetical protein
MSTQGNAFTDRETELHEAVVRNTGLEDFGDVGYRKGLRALLSAIDTDLHLTSAGAEVMHELILTSLAARAYTHRGWADHPEVFRIPIRKPLVVTGLPRSGTTALQQLLSLDPQFQRLEFWLTSCPMVRPPADVRSVHPAYRACVARLAETYARVPSLHAVRETVVASDVVECGGILMQSFVDASWSAYNLPTYGRWLSEQSVRESYTRYADVLRLIGASKPHKQWLLKNPYHMGAIDALFHAFPDACVIQTHRDPLRAIPSFCSLRYMVQQDLEGLAAQPSTIGATQCAYWRDALDRTNAESVRRPNQFFNVDHRDFLRQPLHTIYSVYQHFGLELADSVAQEMRSWIAARPTARQGEHRYDTESWGITSDHISRVFADYRAQRHFG